MTKPKNRLWAVCWKDGEILMDADINDRFQPLIYYSRADAREQAAKGRFSVRPITIKGAKL